MTCRDDSASKNAHTFKEGEEPKRKQAHVNVVNLPCPKGIWLLEWQQRGSIDRVTHFPIKENHSSVS